MGTSAEFWQNTQDKQLKGTEDLFQLIVSEGPVYSHFVSGWVGEEEHHCGRRMW